jgi:TRAP-type C4-dicarboxylate transport system permease large subunit
MIAVIALVAFIAAIVVWNAVFKRNIGEAMIVGLVAVAAFAGVHAPAVVWHSFIEAIQEEVTFAALAFVFMSYLLAKTPVLDRLIDVLNSALGRLRGGPVYASTMAGGMFGAIAHIGASVTAAVGSVTVPWMKRSGVSPELSATVVAGCAGMGITFPFSGTMFILVGSTTVTGLMAPDEIILPLALAGLWCLGYRIAINFYLIRKHKIQSIAPEDRLPFRRSISKGWTSLLLFVPIVIPLLLTRGPLAAEVSAYTDLVMSKAISLITWIPVLMIALVLFLGRRHLPRSVSGWWKVLGDSAPQFGVIGVTIVAAFTASNVLGELGLSDQLTAMLEQASAPAWLMAIIVGVVIVVIAIPLTGSATMAAVGGVAVTALASVGIPVPVAATAVLVFASTEGASPPAAAPIYVASGIARCDPAKTFVPLIKYFCIPILAIGVLIALGLLPVA